MTKTSKRTTPLETFIFLGRTVQNFSLFGFAFLFFCLSAFAQSPDFKEIIFGCYTDTPEEFEQFVVKAKKAGATHIQINAEDLPLAYWQMNPPYDPYPAWVISNPGLLKTFIPNAL